MSFWSGVKDFFTSVGNAISNTLRNSPMMQKLMPILMTVIPPPFDAIAYLAIQVISEAMGVKEDPDQLGFQMNEADKIPEDFESFKEYKAYLDEEFPFDQAKYDALSAEQKGACRYSGMAGVMAELKESSGFEITPNALGILAHGAAALKWDNATIAKFAEGLSTSFRDTGIASLSPLYALVKGTLDPGKYDVVIGAVDAGAKAAGVKEDSETIVSSLQESSKENI